MSSERRNFASPSRKKHVQTATAVFFFPTIDTHFRDIRLTPLPRGAAATRSCVMISGSLIVPWAHKQMRNCSVRCPPRPISIMRQNVAADTTLRGWKKKKRSLYLAHTTTASFAFLLSLHRNVGALARDFPRDYSVLLRGLLDVLVRDGGFKSTIFRRASATHDADTYVHVQCQEHLSCSALMQYCTRYCCAAAHFTFPHFLHFTHA